MCFCEPSCREAAAASDRRLIRQRALTAPPFLSSALQRARENPRGRLLSRRRMELRNSWGLLKERTVCCQFIALFYPPPPLKNCFPSSCLHHCSALPQKHCINYPIGGRSPQFCCSNVASFFQRGHVLTATCARQVKVQQAPEHLTLLNPPIWLPRGESGSQQQQTRGEKEEEEEEWMN